jgi:hypothetical protein
MKCGGGHSTSAVSGRSDYILALREYIMPLAGQLSVHNEITENGRINAQQRVE